MRIEYNLPEWEIRMLLQLQQTDGHTQNGMSEQGSMLKQQR